MRVAVLILAPTLALLLVACDGTDEAPPTATPTPTTAAATPPPATATSTPAPPTATATPTSTPTPTATATPEPDVVYYAADTRTGVEILDAAIEAATSADFAALSALVVVEPTACTTAQGIGGPPKCPAGSAEGTLLTRFGVIHCEGGWSEAEFLSGAVERWITPDDAAAPGSPSLYAIVFIDERFPNMPDDYYAIFGFPDGQGRALSVTDSGITFLWYGCGSKAVEQWPRLSASVESRFLLPPLGR
jgi:hypothetical protein